MIDNFRHEYFFLSDFYPCRIYQGGTAFSTVEHAYHAAKTDDDKTIKRLANLPADKAGTAKHIGNKLKLRPHWDEIRLTVMLTLLRQKFDQKSLKQKLLETKGHELVEGNYHHDNFWGICKCKKCKDIIGQNHLGKQLMHLREEYYEDINNRRHS
jgi:ribA/ribD-fused uncharacterized protein